MPVAQRIEIPDFKALGKDVNAFFEALPEIAAVSAINFFQDRFTQKGWIGNGGLEKWNERKDPNARGSTLLVSGFLKNAFDYQTVNGAARVNNYAPYSSIHNEGGIINIRITKKSKKFFWYMFMKTNDVKWKFMALTKKESFQLQIPKRQFMGHSTFFMKRLELNYIKQLEKLTNKHI